MVAVPGRSKKNSGSPLLSKALVTGWGPGRCDASFCASAVDRWTPLVRQKLFPDAARNRGQQMQMLDKLIVYFQEISLFYPNYNNLFVYLCTISQSRH